MTLFLPKLEREYRGARQKKTTINTSVIGAATNHIPNRSTDENKVSVQHPVATSVELEDGRDNYTETNLAFQILDDKNIAISTLDRRSRKPGNPSFHKQYSIKAISAKMMETV